MTAENQLAMATSDEFRTRAERWNVERDELTDQIASLEDKLGKKEALIYDLTMLNRERHERILVMEQDILDLQKENTDLRAIERDNTLMFQEREKHTTDEAGKQIAELDAELNELKEKFRKKEKEAKKKQDELRRDLDKVRADNVSLRLIRDQRLALTEENKQLQSKLDSFKKDLDGSKDTVEVERAKMRSAFKRQLDAKKTKIMELELEVQNLSTKLSGLSAADSVPADRKQSYRTDCTDEICESTMPQLQISDFDGIHSTMDENFSTNEIVSNSNKSQEGSRLDSRDPKSRPSNGSSTPSGVSSNLASRKASYNTRTSQGGRTTPVANSQIGKLKLQLEQAEKETAKLATEKTSAESRYRTLLTQHRSKSRAWVQEREELEKQLTLYGEDLTALASERDALQDDLRKARTENENLLKHQRHASATDLKEESPPPKLVKPASPVEAPIPKNADELRAMAFECKDVKQLVMELSGERGNAVLTLMEKNADLSKRVASLTEVGNELRDQMKRELEMVKETCAKELIACEKRFQEQEIKKQEDMKLKVATMLHENEKENDSMLLQIQSFEERSREQNALAEQQKEALSREIVALKDENGKLQADLKFRDLAIEELKMNMEQGKGDNAHDVLDAKKLASSTLEPGFLLSKSPRTTPTAKIEALEREYDERSEKLEAHMKLAEKKQILLDERLDFCAEKQKEIDATRDKLMRQDLDIQAKAKDLADNDAIMKGKVAAIVAKEEQLAAKEKELQEKIDSTLEMQQAIAEQLAGLNGEGKKSPVTTSKDTNASVHETFSPPGPMIANVLRKEKSIMEQEKQVAQRQSSLEALQEKLDQEKERLRQREAAIDTRERFICDEMEQQFEDKEKEYFDAQDKQFKAKELEFQKLVEKHDKEHHSKLIKVEEKRIDNETNAKFLREQEDVLMEKAEKLRRDLEDKEEALMEHIQTREKYLKSREEELDQIEKTLTVAREILERDQEAFETLVKQEMEKEEERQKKEEERCAARKQDENICPESGNEDNSHSQKTLTRSQHDQQLQHALDTSMDTYTPLRAGTDFPGAAPEFPAEWPTREDYEEQQRLQRSGSGKVMQFYKENQSEDEIHQTTLSKRTNQSEHVESDSGRNALHIPGGSSGPASSAGQAAVSATAESVLQSELEDLKKSHRSEMEQQRVFIEEYEAASFAKLEELQHQIDQLRLRRSQFHEREYKCKSCFEEIVNSYFQLDTDGAHGDSWSEAKNVYISPRLLERINDILTTHDEAVDSVGRTPIENMGISPPYWGAPFTVEEMGRKGNGSRQPSPPAAGPAMSADDIKPGDWLRVIRKDHPMHDIDACLVKDVVRNDSHSTSPIIGYNVLVPNLTGLDSPGGTSNIPKYRPEMVLKEEVRKTEASQSTKNAMTAYLRAEDGIRNLNGAGITSTVTEILGKEVDAITNENDKDVLGKSSLGDREIELLKQRVENLTQALHDALGLPAEPTSSSLLATKTSLSNGPSPGASVQVLPPGTLKKNDSVSASANAHTNVSSGVSTNVHQFLPIQSIKSPVEDKGVGTSTDDLGRILQGPFLKTTGNSTPRAPGVTPGTFQMVQQPSLHPDQQKSGTSSPLKVVLGGTSSPVGVLGFPKFPEKIPIPETHLPEPHIGIPEMHVPEASYSVSDSQMLPTGSQVFSDGSHNLPTGSRRFITADDSMNNVQSISPRVPNKTSPNPNFPGPAPSVLEFVNQLKKTGLTSPQSLQQRPNSYALTLPISDHKVTLDTGNRPSLPVKIHVPPIGANPREGFSPTHFMPPVSARSGGPAPEIIRDRTPKEVYSARAGSLGRRMPPLKAFFPRRVPPQQVSYDLVTQTAPDAHPPPTKNAFGIDKTEEGLGPKSSRGSANEVPINGSASTSAKNYSSGSSMIPDEFSASSHGTVPNEDKQTTSSGSWQGSFNHANSTAFKSFKPFTRDSKNSVSRGSLKFATHARPLGTKVPSSTKVHANVGAVSLDKFIRPSPHGSDSNPNSANDSVKRVTSQLKSINGRIAFRSVSPVSPRLTEPPDLAAQKKSYHRPNHGTNVHGNTTITPAQAANFRKSFGLGASALVTKSPMSTVASAAPSARNNATTSANGENPIPTQAVKPTTKRPSPFTQQPNPSLTAHQPLPSGNPSHLHQVIAKGEERGDSKESTGFVQYVQPNGSSGKQNSFGTQQMLSPFLQVQQTSPLLQTKNSPTFRTKVSPFVQAQVSPLLQPKVSPMGSSHCGVAYSFADPGENFSTCANLSKETTSKMSMAPVSEESPDMKNRGVRGPRSGNTSIDGNRRIISPSNAATGPLGGRLSSPSNAGDAVAGRGVSPTGVPRIGTHPIGRQGSPPPVSAVRHGTSPIGSTIRPETSRGRGDTMSATSPLGLKTLNPFTNTSERLRGQPLKSPRKPPLSAAELDARSEGRHNTNQNEGATDSAPSVPPGFEISNAQPVNHPSGSNYDNTDQADKPGTDPMASNNALSSGWKGAQTTEHDSDSSYQPICTIVDIRPASQIKSDPFLDETREQLEKLKDEMKRMGNESRNPIVASNPANKVQHFDISSPEGELRGTRADNSGSSFDPDVEHPAPHRTPIFPAR